MLPINIYTYVHDAVSEQNDDKLKDLFFNLFTPELSEITGREVNIFFYRNTESITDFNVLNESDDRHEYGASEGRSVRLRDSFTSYIKEMDNTYQPTNVYLLLVDASQLPEGLKGFAIPEVNVACATTEWLSVVAHEVGHCLGAEHENTAVYNEHDSQGNTTRCYTFMTATTGGDVCQLYRYSDENRFLIQEKLRGAP
ncbi:hypothetical protein SB766_16555 [Pseudomonas sp. SIMBA_077]